MTNLGGDRHISDASPGRSNSFPEIDGYRTSNLGALDPRGPAASDIDRLWWLMLILGTAVFVLFAVLLVLSFRRRGDEGSRDQETTASRWWLYGGGVALPTIVLLVVLVATLVVMQANPEVVASEAPPGAEGGEGAVGDGKVVVVEAVASQYWWEFRYPGEDVVTATEMHIPAGEPVQVVIGSTDVIHSFWVPELAGKRDALPGNTTFLVIEADEPGTFRGRCAEFCGLAHTFMELSVVAHDRPDYEAWLAEQAKPAAEPTTAESKRGKELFLGAGGCASCHTIRGTSAAGEGGPHLTHFADRRSIGAGRLELTAENLREFITHPGDVKEGVLMPPADLTPEEIAAIVAYLQELE